MRLLFCCEFYFPSVGGVQEVMRQLAERMVQRGHEVTVATTRLATRNFVEHNGVRIVEFGATGNAASGMRGEIEQYREFVTNFDGDAIMIKAAQQWTFDALWPVLDRIRMRKVFIPCGFSGLYEPSFKQYFSELPDILRRFDHLIFYAESYRDIDFAREHGLERCSILPNGASETEFLVDTDPDFRHRHGIPSDSFVFLTVGSMTGMKGHREVLEAFALLETGGRKTTLILNGNPPPAPAVVSDAPHAATTGAGTPGTAALRPKRNAYLQAKAAHLQRRAGRLAGLGWRFLGVVQREGYKGVRDRVSAIVLRKFPKRFHTMRWAPRSLRIAADPIHFWMNEARRQPNKQVLKVDLPRPELVQAFKNADLFVFASNIEYSPLVLFETTAAGTPFLSVPVGNAEEIARWTGGGIICPAAKDTRGYTRVDPEALAGEMLRAMKQPKLLDQLGTTAFNRWREQFTWARISERYEGILRGARPEQGNTDGSEK